MREKDIKPSQQPTCDTCQRWGPYARSDGWGVCKRKRWYTIEPLIRIDRPDVPIGKEEAKRYDIVTQPKYGCVEWEGIP